MALPMSRRPPAVEAEKLEEAKIASRIKLDKYKIFMDSMIKWYSVMSKKNRDKLTLSKLRKKAIYVLYVLKYPSERLPLEWVVKLKEATGLRLYRRIKKKHDFSYLEGRELMILVDPLSAEGRRGVPSTSMSGEFGNVKHRFALGRAGEAIKMDLSDSSSDDEDEIIDLSNEPPPPDWIDAYARGEHRRRELTLSEGEDGKRILFYDYEPKYKDFDPNAVPQPIHDGTSFKWFARPKKSK